MPADRLDWLTLDVLADRSPIHVLEIAERTEEHPVSVDLACARLHDEGDIRSVGLGQYELTEQGRQRLDDRLEDRATEEPTV